MDSAKQRCYVAFDVSKATLMVAAPKGMPQGSLDNTQGAVKNASVFAQGDGLGWD